MGDQSGQAVSRAGDVNGDGYDDIVMGAPLAGANGNLKPNAGESVVVFGKSDWSNTPRLTLDTQTLNGVVGFTLFGADTTDKSGTSVSNAGDVNGDGLDDLLISGYAGDGSGNLTSNAGESYLIFGKLNWKSTKTLDLGKLSSSNGLSLFGQDINDGSEDNGVTTSSVSSAGDVNGDGYADFLVSARFADGQGNVKENSGETYLIFGKKFTSGVTQQGTSADDSLTATSRIDKFIAGRGSDTLTGIAAADVVYGGQGNDDIAISSTTFARIDGGNGSDTLRLLGTGLNLNLPVLPNNLLTSIEVIDVRGSGANTLFLNALEVVNITSKSTPSPAANTLTIRRDANDTINIGTGWTKGSDIVQDGLSYETYTQGAATLLLEKLSLIDPTISLSFDHDTLVEDAGTTTITATLSVVSDINIIVMLGFGGTATLPADFSSEAKQIVIPAGSTTGSIVLTAIQDATFEGAETIQIDITGVVNGTEDGAQQVTVQIIDDDHAPVLTSPATASVPENSTTVLTVTATDADLSTQSITFAITGGVDQSRFTITSSGVLRFKSAPDFEVPTDNDADNLYQVDVTADDGHGGKTVQNLTVEVTDVNEVGAASLTLGGPDVTYVRGGIPIMVLPQLTVSGDNLSGGTLRIQVNIVGSNRNASDQFKFPSLAEVGTSTGPQIANGKLTLLVQLGQTVTPAAIQSFLRGIEFSTSRSGLRTATRTIEVTLTDSNLLSSSITQKIRVRKRP